MALPGGRRQPDDPDLVATAMRESAEEVGLALGLEHFAGSLDDVVPRTPVLPPIAVRPFVFVLPGRPPLTLNAEVAAVAWWPMDLLLQPGAQEFVRLDIRGQSRDFPAYRVDEAVVWGMTERILTSLLAHLR
jgi:8-oxo-dGTP pyrophosphatase MutT (NUDIX family)